jgi:peptide subunit release factor 1 (eRF1)
METAVNVQRASRSSVLALCKRLDGDDGEAVYADGRASFTTRPETVEVEPPFRLAFEGRFEPCSTTPLAEHLLLPRRVGLLWVRLGGYAAAIYEDEKLVDGRAGTRFVKNRNKKGGSSSNRFRRRRVEQARDAYDRACALAEEVLAPHAPALDEFVVAGDRTGIEQVLDRSPFLAGLREHALTLPVHVPELRRAILAGLGRELWSSTVELRRQGGDASQLSPGPEA